MADIVAPQFSIFMDFEIPQRPEMVFPDGVNAENTRGFFEIIPEML